MTTHRTHVESPIGTLTLIASEAGIRRILFDGEQTADIDIDTDDDADTIIDSPTPVLEQAARQLDEYFAGDRHSFDLPLDLVGTEFQIEAWRALADVPFGETTSYGAQAEAIGRPGAFRAVGAANGRNPVPIVLPCHRIVGADGSLTGFAGGLDIKQRLLDHERCQQTLPGV